MSQSLNMNTDIMLSLLNRLFESALKPKGLKSLNELTNEKLLKKIILEIEPNIEANGNKIDITDDASFGIRYANIVSIITAIENYKNKSPEKDRFTMNTNFKNIIIVNDLLKNNKEQLILLSELLLFLSSISSKKDFYLDKLGEIDDMKICNAFFAVIEKYLVIDKNDDTINQSHLEKSYIFSSQMNKMKEEYEKQIAGLISIIKENESKISQLQSRNDQLEKSVNDYDLRLKDKERELEMIKTTQNQNFKYQEQLFKDSITNSELMNQLNQKEMELNEMKNILERERKKHNEDIETYKDKNEILEEKLKEIKNVQTKYEKLNIKYKEINNSGSTAVSKMNDKTKDYLVKENQNLQTQMEKIMKELLSEKERYFKTEEERKKLDRTILDLKKELANAKMNVTTNVNNNQPTPVINNISAVDDTNDNKEGFELGNDSFFNELKNKVSDKDYNDLKNERNDLLKMYKSQCEEIKALSKEKEKFETENETNKMEIERLKREVERLGIAKEKAEIQTQKIELNYQKLKIDFDKKETSKNDNYKKEIDMLNSEINKHKSLNEKMLKEKNSIINDYKSLQKEFEKFRAENTKETVHTKIKKNVKKENPVSIQNNQNNEAEILQLKNEIQNLKLQMMQKDETIKSLKNEKEEKDNNEDLDFYKKSYEEQKLRVNEEHKLISESLYKLAVHFMSLKDDLQKKINNNTNNK